MAKETQIHSSKDDPRGALALMHHLKSLGISSPSRALAFYVYNEQSCYVLGETKNIPLSSLKQQEIFSCIKDYLWNVKNENDLSIDVFKQHFLSMLRWGINFNPDNPQKYVFSGEEWDTESKKSDIKKISTSYAEGGDNMSIGKFIDYMSSDFSTWENLFKMEMDEDDLEMMIDRKKPQYLDNDNHNHNHSNTNHLTLHDAQQILKETVSTCQFPGAFVDCLTYENKEACLKLSEDLLVVNDTYKKLGVPSSGLGRVFFSLNNNYTDGTSGFMDAYYQGAKTKRGPLL